MDIFATLRRSGGIDALARQTGMAPPDAAQGVAALLPELVGALRRYIDAAGGGIAGIARLVAAIDSRGGGGLAAHVLHPDPVDAGAGEALVEIVLGRKPAQRAVIARAAEACGIDEAVMARVLPVLAMLVGGYLSALAQAGGSDGTSGLDAFAAALGIARPDLDQPDRDEQGLDDGAADR